MRCAPVFIDSIQRFLKEVLLMKLKVKYLYPCPLSLGSLPHSLSVLLFHLWFLLLLVGLWKPFLLPFMSFPRFNFRWALAFLMTSLGIQCLYFSCMTWPCIPPLHGSFLCLSLVRSSLFNYTGLLPDFLQVGMDHSWTWRIWYVP